LLLRRLPHGRVMALLFLGLAIALPVLTSANRAQANAPHVYEVIDLGTLGGNAAFALDINDRGEVTGNSRTSTSTLPLNAFLWSGGVMNNLGTLPGSNPFSRGYAINNNGVVVGESDNNQPRAFKWDGTELTDLGTLGGATAVAHSVNNAGRIVGSSSNGQTSRPFLHVGGQMYDLGTVAGGLDTPGRAWDINSRGEVVGWSRVAGSTSQATYWRTSPRGSVASVVNLGSLGDGERFSQAFAISDRGWIAGESIVIGSTYRAVLWRNGEIEDLGSMGANHSRANDVNNRGEVVGHVGQFHNFPSFNGRAFVWQDGQMTDLNDLIAPDSGWVLRSAEGINNRGDIVGFGTYNGETRAFLLTVR
jgi:probable HAF family extracellular repeat protein